jgi:hypothetical protein
LQREKKRGERGDKERPRAGFGKDGRRRVVEGLARPNAVSLFGVGIDEVMQEIAARGVVEVSGAVLETVDAFVRRGDQDLAAGQGHFGSELVVIAECVVQLRRRIQERVQQLPCIEQISSPRR